MFIFLSSQKHNNIYNVYTKNTWKFFRPSETAAAGGNRGEMGRVAWCGSAGCWPAASARGYTERERDTHFRRSLRKILECYAADFKKWRRLCPHHRHRRRRRRTTNRIIYRTSAGSWYGGRDTTHSGARVRRRHREPAGGEKDADRCSIASERDDGAPVGSAYTGLHPATLLTSPKVAQGRALPGGASRPGRAILDLPFAGPFLIGGHHIPHYPNRQNPTKKELSPASSSSMLERGNVGKKRGKKWK